MLRVKLPQKHCSEEQLLAFLDSELQSDARRNVQDHLARCWHCRGKMTDLEGRAQQLAALLSDPSFLGHERVTTAREKFLTATRADVDAPHTQFRFLDRPPLSRSLAASWLAAAMVLAGFGGWTLYNLLSTNPAQVLSAAVQDEAVFLREPVHQEFRMNLVGYQPKRLTRSGDLEIWSDQQHSRFASTWKKDHGELEYAVWQPDLKRQFRYDEGLREGIPVNEVQHDKSSALYSVVTDKSDFKATESRFTSWIMTRQWRPISLAADFSLFVNEQGALLRSERTFSGGQPSITMTATSSQSVGRIVMKLELDEVTHQPRAQEVRFDSAGESFAIRVAVTRMEHPAVNYLQASLFTPNVPIAYPPETPVETAVPARLITAVTPAPPPPSESEITNAAIKIEYELHRLAACTGESIAVTGDHGGIAVTGVLEDPARKKELLQSLQMLNLPRWVSIKVETLDEAAARVASGDQVAPLSTLENAAAAPVISSGLPVNGLPLDGYLTSYFAKHGPPPQLGAEMKDGKAPGTPQEQTAVYSSMLVSLSQRSYRHSWAIRRLAEKFGSRKDLSEESLWLVETMLRDHARELGAAMEQIQALLGPAFNSASSVATDASSLRAADLSSQDWRSGAMTIFEDADAVNLVLFKLFASGTEPHPEEAVSEVISKIPALQKSIQTAETLELRAVVKNQVSSTHDTDPN